MMLLLKWLTWFILKGNHILSHNSFVGKLSLEGVGTKLDLSIQVITSMAECKYGLSPGTKCSPSCTCGISSTYTVCNECSSAAVGDKQSQTTTRSDFMFMFVTLTQTFDITAIYWMLSPCSNVLLWWTWGQCSLRFLFLVVQEPDVNFLSASVFNVSCILRCLSVHLGCKEWLFELFKSSCHLEKLVCYNYSRYGLYILDYSFSYLVRNFTVRQRLPQGLLVVNTLMGCTV